jgi:hypothetical protein
MKKYFTAFLFFVTAFINLTYSQTVISPYLNNPDLVFGYVDSCAAFWER